MQMKQVPVIVMLKNKKIEALGILKEEVLSLKRSPLYQFRQANKYQPVIGEGSVMAKIMFVGEAPGKKEAETGRPFCGRAGKVLDDLLSDVGLKREKVYITNIVNDRPPENRDPTPEEIEIYGPFLGRQIEIVQPKIIVTLGRFPMSYVMNLFGLRDEMQSISVLHGKIFETGSSYGKIRIIPLYHPAAAIYNQKLKETLKKDFETLRSL